jgi:hypothetical protein
MTYSSVNTLIKNMGHRKREKGIARIDANTVLKKKQKISFFFIDRSCLSLS